MNEPENGTSLTLDEVTKRFADSERALSQAREKLEALAAAEATQAAAARGLQEASSATTEFVKTAQSLITQAAETQRLAREVLEAGGSLIDGTDLKELQTELSSTSGRVQDGFAHVEQLIGEARERDERIAGLEAELARRSAVLTGRQRKKLALD
jgi:hypothetical protein